MRINDLSHDPSISDSATTPVSYHNLVPQPPRLFLIDSFGFIFRAHHARARSAAPPMRPSAGLSTKAAYIFNNMLRKLAKSYAPEHRSHRRKRGPVARMAEFAEYKANLTQIPLESVSAREAGRYALKQVYQAYKV
jgi:hypothetical protein